MLCTQLFYLICGLMASLSIVGIMFMFYWYNGDTTQTMPETSCTACSDCCLCCCSPGRPMGPIFIGDPCAGNPECCCNGCCASSAECCGQGSAVGGSSCAECCSVATVGEECLVVLAFAFVILAAIGLVVSVFAGIVYANRSIQRHVHIVSKRTMTKDLVVRDLAPGATDIPCTHAEEVVSIDSMPQIEEGDIETGFLMTHSYHGSPVMRRDD